MARECLCKEMTSEQVRGEMCKYLTEDHSRQRGQSKQEPWGGHDPGVFLSHQDAQGENDKCLSTNIAIFGRGRGFGY